MSCRRNAVARIGPLTAGIPAIDRSSLSYRVCSPDPGVRGRSVALGAFLPMTIRGVLGEDSYLAGIARVIDRADEIELVATGGDLARLERRSATAAPR
jgi:hypothetical protein